MTSQTYKNLSDHTLDTSHLKVPEASLKVSSTEPSNTTARQRLLSVLLKEHDYSAKSPVTQHNLSLSSQQDEINETS